MERYSFKDAYLYHVKKCTYMCEDLIKYSTKY